MLLICYYSHFSDDVSPIWEVNDDNHVDEQVDNQVDNHVKGYVSLKLVKKPIFRDNQLDCLNCGHSFSNKYVLKRHFDGYTDKKGHRHIPCREKIATYIVKKVLNVRIDEHGQYFCLLQFSPSIVNIKCITDPEKLLDDHGNKALIKYWTDFKTQMSHETEDKNRGADTDEESNTSEDESNVYTTDEPRQSDQSRYEDLLMNIRDHISSLSIDQGIKYDHLCNSLKRNEGKSKLDMQRLLILSDKDGHDGHFLATRHACNKGYGIECPSCNQKFSTTRNRNRHMIQRACRLTNEKDVIWEDYVVDQILRSYECSDDKEW